MPNNSEEFETKPSSNKVMWLFLIVLYVIFLCVFGFFLYKHFAGQLFNVAPSTRPVQMEEKQVPEISEEEVVTVDEDMVSPAPLPEETIVPEPVEPIAKSIPEQPSVVAEPESVQPQVVAQETKESVVVTPTAGKYRRVTFRWFGEGDTVSVVSGFTMSKPQALKRVADHWETTLSIAPGTYKFLYVIDGKNTLDPYSPQKDGRSVLEVK